MTRFILTRVVRAASSAIALTVSSAAALAGGEPFVPEQAIVALRPPFSIADFNTRYLTSTLGQIEGRPIFLVTVPAGQEEEQFVQQIRLDPDVAAADVNFFAEDVNPEGSTQSFFLSLDEPGYIGDPNFTLIGAPAAQTIGTGTGATVAVVDTGVDASHPRLAGRIAPGGFDFFSNDANPADVGDGIDNNNNGAIDEFVGHGTLVAGIAARVAPGAMILPIRVMGTDGECTTFLLSQGIFHAIDLQARVINVSIGVSADPFPLRFAAAEAASRAIVLVAAAGNDDRTDPPRSPAALVLDGVLGVTATNSVDIRAPFANFGAWVSLSAPGVAVAGPVPGGGYGSATGSSFSAPLVSGAAAIVRSICPGATTSQIREVVRNSATSIDGLNPSFVGQLGSGRINVHAAAALASNSCAPTCAGDYDFDRARNLGDIAVTILYWDASYPAGAGGPGDGDLDGTVGLADLALIIQSYELDCPPR